ncbi:MAG: hypothetical protein Q8N95_06210 [Desulfobacterales bacterium]|nr:hypothetical protein [Desulfobacterales bacterium]
MRQKERMRILMGLSKCGLKEPYCVWFVNELSDGYPNLCARNGQITSIIIPVDQVHDDLDDDLFVFGTAFRNHESQCHKSIVAYSLMAIIGIKNITGIQKPDEQESGNTLIPVDERVIFNNEI